MERSQASMALFKMQTKTNNQNTMKTKHKTLLEQVKSIPIKERGRPVRVLPDPDVAIAWLKGEIRGAQIGKALYPNNPGWSNSTNIYSFINRSVMAAYEQGKIKIVG